MLAGGCLDLLCVASSNENLMLLYDSKLSCEVSTFTFELMTVFRYLSRR